MDQSTALRIAQRFATLAADKQKIYWQKMLQENVSPANLPIPSVQAHFARLPLSYAQERQWFLWQLDPNSAAYNVPLALRLTGPLNLAALEQSFNGLVARHETLRTAFEQSDEGLHQRIEPAIQWVLEVQSVAPGQDLDAATADFVQQQSRQPFDLSQAPLLRVKLLRLASEEHVLALTLHHIVSDGWSAPILIDELIRRYQACCQGLAPSFDALPVQYADYAIWQRQWMEAGERERQLQYWLAQLGGEQPRLQLPTDHPRLNVRSQSGGRWQWSLPTPLAGALARVAQDQGVTLFMLLLASFQTLLHRYSGQADIRVGVASANRNRVETEGLIGFFVNTQVLRADFGQAEDFSALLAQVKQRALDALVYQELPFEQLVEALQPERTLGQNPLFEVMFNFQSESAGQGAARQVAGLLVESLDSGRQAAQFDLTLDITERDGQLFAAFDYAADLFESATLERMTRHWESLLQGIVADPSQRISQLPLQDRQEQAAIVQDWNRHQTRFNHEQVLHQLIEAQAARAPDAVALSLGSAQLTYAQLNTRANRLAHRLIAQGVGPEVRVGLAAERSLEMLVGLLAILKAGGAYVPLDPSYPEERLSYMIEDSGIGLLLVQPHLLDRLPVPEHVVSILLETDESSDAVENPNVSVDPANLAYVIYTSGSTGKPKGALLAHQNVVRLFDATESWFHFDDQDVWTLFHSYAFDFSVWEIFGALLHGGRLVIVPQETSRSPEDFHRLLCEERVTVLNQTPSAFKPLMAVACAGSQANHLRYVVFGGEALEVKALKPWFERFGDSAPQLVNMYGITETTVHVTYRPLSLADLNLNASSPIGEPIPDLSWYLLDRDLNPVPRGCVGELYIGREGLARGYLNRSDLSATRFVPDPFDDQGGRLYRTGDLARYHADGLIEYIGRIDQQVKIRGFRIELGEIEARLLAQPEVREVAVLAQDGAGGPQLVAYLVASQGAVPAEDQAALRTTIKEGLKEHLPDYMVPAHVLFLEQLPLTANGKLDRKALPAADASLLQRAFVAPQSPLQQQVAAIWQEVLQVERVGLDDNFFELGGHSLLATQLVSRIRQGLQREVALKSLFEHDTLGTFVAALEGGAQRQESSLPRVERGQPLALSYAQERQWFLWQMDPHSAAYHVPMALRLKGALDRRALQSSFEALVARHESLRTTFVEQGSRTLQVIHADAAPVIVWADLAQQGADQDAAIQAFVAEEIQQPFDLRQGPLLRIKLLRLAPDDHVLVLVQHHIVSDGWSMRLMVDELVQLYGDFSEAQVPSLPALPIQYADYAQWQRNWMDAGERERQLAYWQEQLAGESALLELPLDRPRPAQQSFRGARLDLPLPERLAEHLKALARSEGVTLFMLLLASFQTLLHRYSGQADIRVGVPIANRNRAETESLIGFFVNTQVLKAEIDSQGRFRDFLQQVKQASLGAQAHQDLPFEQLVEALQPGRSLSHSPLFQVLFNHQAATHEETRQLPGLVIEDLSWAGHTAQFDLTLDTHESANGIWASLTYATDVFDPTTVQRMAQHWHTLLQGVVDDPSQRISQLPLQGREEQAAIVQDWNRHQTRFNHEQVLHQLIEAQATRAPEAVALSLGSAQLTYAQLNTRANRLAHRLIAQGVGPEVRVGLAAERSLEMLVGLLAILKAGGAYVPLDPSYPEERLSYMIEDSGIGLLLVQPHLLDRLPVPEHVASILLETDESSDAVENPNVSVDPANLAYVIYTSGSTGKPKGALLAHQNVVRLFDATESWFHFDDQDVWTLFHSYAFDFSVWEIFGALLHGGRLVIVPQETSRSPEDFHRLLCEERVTVLNQTPSAFKPLMAVACAGSQANHLRYVVFGGEALEVKALKPWFERFGDSAPQLVNMYGITETTVHVTYRPLSLADLNLNASSPIGEPIPDLSWYLLDSDLNPVPRGCVGELYIGREGLARGYLNRSDLSATRFVPDPFDDQGGRLYRTGDLARYHADGLIEYIGRIDQQVKIRGFRIELGEIEARLLAQPEVREVAVLAQDGAGGPQLVAYLVASQGAVPTEDQAALRTTIKEGLKEHLPDYMVPAHVLFLEQLPLTANGKLDRKALPAADASLLQRAFVAPQSPLQQQVAAIWQEVLQVERVGLDDNFFELGGHSLLATQVTVRMREQLNLEVPLKSLFTTADLGAFCESFAEAQNDSQAIQDTLAKSLEALRRLSADDLENLIS